MYNFTDLIARSYIEYSKEKEENIAHFFFQEYYQVRPNSGSNYISTKDQFFKKLIREIDKLTSSTVYNRHIDKSLYSYEAGGNEEENFKNWEDKRLKDHQLLLDDQGVNITIKRKHWETHTNAKEINEALDEGLNLKDPVRIISFSNETNSEGLVLRKSKLEYLKKEAERANKAITIDQLNNIDKLKELDCTKINQHVDSRKKKEDILEQFILNALTIIKPLGGIYITEQLLNEYDLKRLNSYVRSIIETQKLPSDTSSFPKINISNQFIKKTIHKAYISLEKKQRDEFIKLIHLFDQFQNSEPSTTNSKFSTYEGTYDEILNKISY